MRRIFLVLALVCLSFAAQARTDVTILARTCNNCHGVGGVSAGASMPSIGGLQRDYLRRVMKQWKYDERSAITMSRIVKGFSDDEIDALADYFAKQPWTPVVQKTSPEAMDKGLATVSKICTDCHGKAGSDPDVDAPNLNGQWARYMELELEKYRSGEFKMPHRKMKKAIHEASPADAAAAARYFGAQSK
ncbi:putative Cytochrome c, class I [Rhodospirillaceae bacterium LM-1]|nr:putative Cytochrome c, class I [Rhodospirillaceae bacterium LM-1]